MERLPRWRGLSSPRWGPPPVQTTLSVFFPPIFGVGALSGCSVAVGLDDVVAMSFGSAVAVGLDDVVAVPLGTVVVGLDDISVAMCFSCFLSEDTALGS